MHIPVTANLNRSKRMLRSFTSHSSKLYKNPLPFLHQETRCSNIQPNSFNLETDCSNGHLHQALSEMAKRGLENNFKDYNSLLNECVNLRAYREGQRVHAHMIKTRYLPPVYLHTRLVVFYLKCERLSDARHVFDEMPEKSVVSWTAVISGYSRRGYGTEAINLYVKMLRAGIEPNEFTFTTVLTACSGAPGTDCGRQIHSHIVKSPYEFHIFVGSSLLDMYAKAGRIQEAQCIFENLPERDVVSCTAIISAYAQQGLDDKALDLFRRLQLEGMTINYVTYASLLTALSGLAAYEQGRQVHAHVLRSELPFYVVLQNSLIDMYSKCGNLSYARRIFDGLSERTVISWNTILIGYSKNGKGRETVELYDMMRAENSIKPDSVTLLAVLSGCSHGGMEEKGLEIFSDIISGTDRLHFGIEHYGCVIDMLGRAGQLERALKFVEQMPLEPTAAIWGSLLGACMAHMNLDIGEIASRRLLEIEPENSENYVNLANLYASAGRWEDVREVRELMEGNSVKKEAGRSWMELDQAINT